MCRFQSLQGQFSGSIYLSSCYDLNTVTFKMELFETIVNGFHHLNVACQGSRFPSC